MSRIEEGVAQIASTTTPLTFSVGGMTLLGVSLSDWILILTLLLAILQVIVILPKVKQSVKAIFGKNEKDNKVNQDDVQ